jgi:hypothetical protein
MILTFQQIYEEVQSGTQSSSASELVLIKRDANIATQRFKSVMSRPWSRIAKKADSVASQQDYQLPRSVLRIMGVDYLSGSTYYPLIEVGSEQNWNALNAMGYGTGEPRFFFPKGKDVISIFPTPGTAVTEGIRVYYEPKQPRMISADYTTGTITVTNGSTTITHSATGFSADMIGRYFYITDSTGDGNDYQIVDYTSTSALVLENYYEGTSGAGKSFLIGAVPDIPDEYQTAIVDYCMGRFFLRKGDKNSGTSFISMFTFSLDECKETYSSPTSMPNIHSLYDMSFNMFDTPPGVLS